MKHIYINIKANTILDEDGNPIKSTRMFALENRATTVYFDFTDCEVDDWEKIVDFELADGSKYQFELGDGVVESLVLNNVLMKEGLLKINPFAKIYDFGSDETLRFSGFTYVLNVGAVVDAFDQETDPMPDVLRQLQDNKADKDSVYTKSETYTKDEVDQMTVGGDVDLTQYSKWSELNPILDNKVDDADLTQYSKWEYLDPILDNKVDDTDLSDVSFSGDYEDLLNKPNILDIVRHWVTIPNGSDFNNYVNNGRYGISSNDAAGTMSNIPEVRAGWLEVQSLSNYYVEGGVAPWERILQIYTTLVGDRYERTMSSDGNGVWSYGAWSALKIDGQIYQNDGAEITNGYVGYLPAGNINLASYWRGLKNGMYHKVSSTAQTNQLSEWAHVWVIGTQNADSREKTIIWKAKSDGDIYHSGTNENTTTMVWAKLLDTRNYNIESGSNSNGSWTKFPDGTMICRKTFPTSPSSYDTRTITGGHIAFMWWYFPQSFINSDVQVTTSGDSAGWALDSTGSWGVDTSGSYVGLSSNAPITEVRLQATAIGRWK